MFWALVQVAGALPEGLAVQAGQLAQEQEQPEDIKLCTAALSDHLKLRDT